MKNVPLVAAIGLLVVWGAMFFAIPLTLDLFKVSKVEMPALTMWMLTALRFADGLALPMLVLATATLLRLRQSVGWIIAVILCGACDVAGLALLLPLISLTNSLGATPLAPPISVGSSPGVLLAAFALIFSQFLFVLLIRKQREFWVQPKSDGPLLPIK